MVEGNQAGIVDCVDFINADWITEGKETIGKSVIMNSLCAMKPKSLPVQEICQGSEDPHDNWSMARFLLAKQMLICMGSLDPLVTPDPLLPPRQDGQEQRTIPRDLLTAMNQQRHLSAAATLQAATAANVTAAAANKSAASANMAAASANRVAHLTALPKKQLKEPLCLPREQL